MTYTPLIALIACTAMSLAHGDEQGAHLFILSGQSNMRRLRPEQSFTPAVTQAFGQDKVIVVKDAMGGEPIRRWDKGFTPADDWQTLKPAAPQTPVGDLYDRLMARVTTAIQDRSIATVTFVWMQGETDAEANEMHGAVYGASLARLIEQLKKDLQRTDINVVLGRINDCHMDNEHSPHWTMVREAQVKFATSNKRYDWVDTDDLNGPRNDIHMQGDGYVLLGQRFAAKAIALIHAAHGP